MQSFAYVLGSLRHSGAIFVVTALMAIAPSSAYKSAQAETTTSQNQPLTILSDVQEANAITGVVTARGNVQIFYPARQVQASAVQAQYYSREGRIVLSGNVYVLQDGNSLQGETITYLVEEGRFLALPEEGEQVQAVYLVPESNGAAQTTSVIVQDSIYDPKPEFKTPMSP
jgi:lipopolysaccharide export system protein LptA